MTNVVDYALGAMLNRPVARLLGATQRGEHPLPEPPAFRPHVTGRRYSFSHYNVVIPDLPEPHRFMATAVMVGQSGVRAFDADHATVGGRPHRTATVAHGTGATAPAGFDSYDVGDECDLAQDGSHLRFGDRLTLDIAFPRVRLSSALPDFRAELELLLRPEPTWFARSPLYDHYGLQSTYTGTIRFRRRRVLQVDGTGTFEYARMLAPQMLLGRSLPGPLKLPLNYFTYHVIALDPQTVLMLTEVLAFGRPAIASAYLKRLGGEQLRYVEGVELTTTVTSGSRRLIAPDGRGTAMPQSFRWTLAHPGGGAAVLELEGTPDTECIYGIGSGWIGGIAYTGRYAGRRVSVRGYFEYIDRR